VSVCVCVCEGSYSSARSVAVVLFTIIVQHSCVPSAHVRGGRQKLFLVIAHWNGQQQDILILHPLEARFITVNFRFI